MHIPYNSPSEHPTAALIQECMDMLEKKAMQMESTMFRLIVSECSFGNQYHQFQHSRERMIRLQNSASENNVTSDEEPGNIVDEMLKRDARQYAFNRQRIITALKGDHCVINATVERITVEEYQNLVNLNIKVRGVKFYKMTCNRLIRLIEGKLITINNVRNAVTDSTVSDYLNEDMTKNFVNEMTNLLDKYAQMLHKIALTC